MSKMSGKNAPAGAVHRVDGELEIRPADQIQIGKLAHRLNIGGLQVHFFDFGGLPSGHRAGGEFVFDDLHDGGRSRSAKLGFKLHAIPVPRIVAGCDHDAARRAQFLDVVRNRRAWERSHSPAAQECPRRRSLARRHDSRPEQARKRVSMSDRKIIVKAARTQEYVENGQCDVVFEFDTLKEARTRAKYYLSDDYRRTSESSERLGYSAVFVNGECVNDYFGGR